MSLEKSILKLTKVIHALKFPQTNDTKPYTGKKLPEGCVCTQRAQDGEGPCVSIKCNDGTYCDLYWDYNVEWRCRRIGVQGV